MRRLIRFPVLLCLFAVLTATVFAQEGGIVLASVDYEIKGHSRRFAVEKYLGLEIGKVFPDEAALASYVNDAQRQLFNNRVFDPASTVEYRIDVDPDGERKAHLTVTIVDSMAAVVVPIPKYSSSDGFSLAVRYKDYNFFGTLDLLSVGLDYYSRSGEIETTVVGDIPFPALGGSWNLSMNMDLTFPYEEEPISDSYVKLSGTYPWTSLGLPWFVQPFIYYDADPGEETTTGGAGASVGFRYMLWVPWTLSTSASFVLKNDTGVFSEYFSNGLSLSTSFPLFRLGSLGDFIFAPSTTVYVNTEFPDSSIGETGWTSTASLAVGKVNWYGNFRHGASFSASGTYTKRFIYDSTTDPWSGYLSVDAAAFTEWKNLIGLNARLLGRWYPDWSYLYDSNTDYDWDDNFRGHVSAFYGDIGLVLNLEMPINMAQGRFFGMDFLESEVFFTPFLDAGFVRTDPTEELSLQNDGIVDVGCEFTVFPTKARAFAYRFSVGYDLLDLIETRNFEFSNLEIFLGLGTLF
jgi:hypothetical protein